MLIETIDARTLKQRFKEYDRDYFSDAACQALVDYFEDTDCGNNTELDIIALCCEFTEYPSFTDWFRDYKGQVCLDKLIKDYELTDEDEIEAKCKEELEDETWFRELEEYRYEPDETGKYHRIKITSVLMLRY